MKHLCSFEAFLRKLTKNNPFSSKMCFFHQNEPHTAEAFLRKLKKNTSFMLKKCFSNQYEPHTAKLSISGILKYLCGYSHKQQLLRSKNCFLINMSQIQLNAFLVF